MAERTVKIKVVGEGKDAVVREYRSMFTEIRNEAQKTADLLNKSFGSSLKPRGSDNLIRDEIRAQKDLLGLMGKN